MAHLDINFLSNALNRNVDIKLILPTKTAWTLENKYEAKTNTFYQDKKDMKYPLLILLHGYTGSLQQWLGFTRAEMYAEENNIAIVTVSGENKWFINTEYDKYYDFIEYELKDFLYGNFPISKERSDNYIAGLSMGGFGALYHALSNPLAYNKVGAFSPALYPKAKSLLKGNEIEELTLSNKDNLPNIYFSIGDKDFLLDDTNKYSKFLDKNNIKYEYSLVEGYSHEWRFWDMELEKFIKSLDRTDEAYKHAPKGG